MLLLQWSGASHQAFYLLLLDLDNDANHYVTSFTTLFDEVLVMPYRVLLPFVFSGMEKILQLKTAELLIRLKHLKCTTQPVVRTVIKGVDEIVDLVLQLIEERCTRKCGENGAMSPSEINSVLNGFRGFSLFEELNSDDKIDSFLKAEHSLVFPVKEVFKKDSIVRGTETKEVDVDYAYWVPFLPSLEQVLSCPEILQCVRNPPPVKEGVFTSPLDGCYYKNHPVVLKDPHTLAIATYGDGVCMTDTAGSKSSEENETLIYWTLLNIDSELRSSEDAVFLLGVVKTKVLKKYGYSKLLANFVEGMQKLSNGVHLKINGQETFFHGILVFNSADTPAAASLGGFKETHFAEKFCRQCLVSTEDMYKSFVESDFPTRSYLEHSKQVAEVEAFRRTKDNKDAIDPSKHYGINSRSMFMDIPLCDVTKVFPQDLMHTTIEGTLSLEICLLISHALERGKISLPRINERIAKFSKKFGCNKPARIDKDHIDRRRLHQTASETLSLAFMLPFVLRKKNMLTGKMESVCAEENLKCFIMRLELLDLQMSREITVTDVETIRAMTNEHHLMFQRLYPGEEIPKMHFETHYASQILLFGPLRYHWCFRYESKHSYFKKLYRALRSVKNLPKTLAENHQRHQAALMMLSAKGLQGPFLRENNSFGASVEKLLKAVPVTHQELLRGVFGGISSNTPIKVFKRCVIRGVKYTKGSAIISDFKETLPVFGEVVAFYRHDNQNAVVFKNMVTISYEAQLKAFKVGFVVGPFQLNVMKLSDFVYHHHLPFIKSVGANYVSVQCKSFHRK